MIGMIWAQAADRVIGADGGIPWSLPEDQRRFRRLTTGADVLMGRRTWESLPRSVRPLPGRGNLVLSGSAGFEAPGALIVPSVDAALEHAASDERDLWVIGGAAVYAAALGRADRIEVTEVDLSVAGDTRAPELDDGWSAAPGAWQRSADGIRYRFVTYLRR